MVFFNVYTSEFDSDEKLRLFECMDQMQNDLHTSVIKTMTHRLPDGTWQITVAGQDIEGEQQVIAQQLSAVLARYLITVKQRDTIERTLTKRYCFEDQADYDNIEQLCYQLLGSGSNDGDGVRMECQLLSMQKGIEALLQDKGAIHLDGYLRFRMWEYTEKLIELIDYTVEQYLMDRQYEEFIGMLQYFVYFQEPLTPLIHLMHKGEHEFSILNDQYTAITSPPISGVVAQMADQQLEMEDVVVSTLIALSPNKVIIHTLEPRSLIIKTISQIFGERVELCASCSRCKHFHQVVRAKK